MDVGMKAIRILEEEKLCNNVRILEEDDDFVLLTLPKEGGGVILPQIHDRKERYLSFYLTINEVHSMAMNLFFFGKENKEEAVFKLRFGVLGGIKTFICIDLNLLDGATLFPEAEEGGLKMVCHGRRIEREEVEKVILASLPCYHEISTEISGLRLTDEIPARDPLPDGKLVDELGQNNQKEWSSKTRSVEELQERLLEQYLESVSEYPFDDWSAYGGWKGKKLTEGTGYFTKLKTDKRWWLVDPEGYAFISMGPDCVGVEIDCRIDGVEKWLDWLPNREEEAYKECFRSRKNRWGKRDYLAFNYGKANLYRAFGDDWYDKWKTMIAGQLKGYGMNTIGNWSDSQLFGLAKIPYVTSLSKFPDTKTTIFRDFPDVFSDEYKENAVLCAESLKDRKEDPYMIGYFLRNEPAWAFVDNLILAEEVLYSKERTACREKLIKELKEKYVTISNLNAAWNCELAEFDDLYMRQKKVSSWSKDAMEDMKEFSRKMLCAYVEIPSRECRKVDPNHMILGMRWAWISDEDIVSGWENFDVFSINCYAVDPTKAIEHVVNLKVDLPIMIGEFHFGALDAGLTATGLEGVASQEDRGKAYRYYCERAAAHPYGVGCHYFQCYDQFYLGRFDGENYNIGLFDICFRPYPEMMEQVMNCSRSIYEVADGIRKPTDIKGRSIPMIAY